MILVIRLRKKERHSIILSYLNTILQEGGSGNFVIFTDPETHKLVQFAATKGDKVVLFDIPMQSLSIEETNRLEDHFGPLLAVTDYAYQGEVSPEQGAICAEKIFRDVYQLPDRYSIETEITLE